MKNYIDLGKKILREGHTEKTRLHDTVTLHNQSLSYDLTKGWPLMTNKHVGHNSIIHETLWYLQGTTSIKYLEENGVFVWSMFADDNKDIGKTYSYQFRNFNGLDQVAQVIEQLNVDDGTTNRRAIINLYNSSQVDEMSIPPCIALLQFNVYYKDNVKYLSTSIYQRSADFCLGVPYDIAEMALIAEIIAAYTDSVAKDFTIFYSNIHVYKPHIEELTKQLDNAVYHRLPTITLNKERIKAVRPEELTRDMFKVRGLKKARPRYDFELF